MARRKSARTTPRPVRADGETPDGEGGTWLGDLVRGCHAAILGRLGRRLRSPEDAEDALQDVYLRLIETGQGRESDRPQAYLTRSASNAAIDRRRESARRARLHGAYGAAAGWDGTTGEPLAPGADPEAALAARQRLDAVLKALDALPPKCREAFWLHRFEGLRYREIAERLEVSPSMVEKYVMRALDHCRRTVL